MPSVPGLPLMAGSIAASYAKRLLDPTFYDRVMETGTGRSLRALDPGRKYSLEFLAYFVNSVMDIHLTERTAVRKFFKNIVGDGIDELTGRMVRRQYTLPYWGRESLMELTDEELHLFLEWYDRADEGYRREIMSVIKRKTARQLGKLLRLHPGDRARLVSLISDRPAPVCSKRISWLDRITNRLNGRGR